MKLAHHALNLAKLLYDRAPNPLTKERIAKNFFENEANMVLEDMKRKQEEEWK